MKYSKSTTVKNHPLFVAAMLILGLSCFTTTARADYKPDFSAPPYTIGNTILGVDGWDFRLVDDKNTDESAYVESVSLKQEKTVIVLENAALKNVLSEPIIGERVSLTFALALEFPGKVQPGHQFRIWVNTTALGEVYFEEGEEGGLGYRGVGDGRTGGVICVPAMDFVEGSFYTFLIEIDALTQTYKISVTGEKSDGSPLSYTAEGVEFLSPGKGTIDIRSIELISRSVKAYLGSLAVEVK